MISTSMSRYRNTAYAQVNGIRMSDTTDNFIACDGTKPSTCGIIPNMA